MHRISATIASVMLVTSSQACFAQADDRGLRTIGSRIIVEPSRVTVELEPVVTELQRPVAVRAAGDASGRLFVVEQPGRIRVIDTDGLQTTLAENQPEFLRCTRSNKLSGAASVSYRLEKQWSWLSAGSLGPRCLQETDGVVF